jgi:hypothetical protein
MKPALVDIALANGGKTCSLGVQPPAFEHFLVKIWLLEIRMDKHGMFSVCDRPMLIISQAGHHCRHLALRH